MQMRQTTRKKEKTRRKLQTLARLPSGELSGGRQFNVTILKATDVGDTDVAPDGVYCVCRIRGATDASFTTKTAQDATNPVWNEAGTLNGAKTGDKMAFAIYANAVSGSKNKMLGRSEVVLGANRIDFDGSVELVKGSKASQATMQRLTGPVLRILIAEIGDPRTESGAKDSAKDSADLNSNPASLSSKVFQLIGLPFATLSNFFHDATDTCGRNTRPPETQNEATSPTPVEQVQMQMGQNTVDSARREILRLAADMKAKSPPSGTASPCSPSSTREAFRSPTSATSPFMSPQTDAAKESGSTLLRPQSPVLQRPQLKATAPMAAASYNCPAAGTPWPGPQAAGSSPAHAWNYGSLPKMPFSTGEFVSSPVGSFANPRMQSAEGSGPEAVGNSRTATGYGLCGIKLSPRHGLNRERQGYQQSELNAKRPTVPPLRGMPDVSHHKMLPFPDVADSDDNCDTICRPPRRTLEPFPEIAV